MLTIDFENKVFNSDAVLSELFLGERGKQIKIKDLRMINSETNDRVYEWVHNWAGLYLDVQKMISVKDSIPTFMTNESEENSYLSTKLIMNKIWQRLVSKSILNLQLNYF